MYQKNPVEIELMSNAKLPVFQETWIAADN